MINIDTRTQITIPINKDLFPPNKFCLKIGQFILLFVLLFMHIQAVAQEKLVKDIDFDGVKDTVYHDIKKSVIVCKLSTQKFRRLQSKPLGEMKYATSYGVHSSQNGFEFIIEFNRYGYANQFRYDRNAKKIRLIGMRRRESGLSSFDANGGSSVNLLTGDYIGNWQYNDVEHDKYLIEIPAIKTKMWFGKIYLDNFNEDIYDNYSSKCSALFVEHKDLEIKRRNRTNQ